MRPGLIATEMTAPVIESFRARAADGLTMAPRVGEPEEVVRLIATPAGERLPWTTGQAVDGGMLVPRFRGQSTLSGVVARIRPPWFMM